MVALVGTASAADPGGGNGGSSSNNGGNNGNTKVKICHRTEANGNASNPYTTNNVSTSSTDAEGHSSHTGPIWTPELQSGHDADPSNPAFLWGDIIPPTDGLPSGLNWTTAGQAIWDNGCQVPGGETPDSTTFTVTKQWVVDGAESVEDNNEDGMVPGSLTVGGDAAGWDVAISWDGDGWPTVVEADDAVLTDEECSVSRYAVDHGEAIVDNEDNVITVTNYVTCDSGGETTTTPATTTTTTPATTTTTTTVTTTTSPAPAIVVPATSVVETPAPVIVVEGVSQELPPAPVIAVKPAAQVEAAPSANAHTGQGQNPWMYLLFGTGALLMLGAWRARRHESA